MQGSYSFRPSKIKWITFSADHVIKFNINAIMSSGDETRKRKHTWLERDLTIMLSFYEVLAAAPPPPHTRKPHNEH